MKRDLLAAVSGIHLSGSGVDLRRRILGHFPISRGPVRGRTWGDYWTVCWGWVSSLASGGEASLTYVPGPEALVPPFLSPSPSVCLSRWCALAWADACLLLTFTVQISYWPSLGVGVQDRFPHPRGRPHATVVPGECWLWRTKQCSHDLIAHDEATREQLHLGLASLL